MVIYPCLGIKTGAYSSKMFNRLPANPEYYINTWIHYTLLGYTKGLSTFATRINVNKVCFVIKLRTEYKLSSVDTVASHVSATCYVYMFLYGCTRIQKPTISTTLY